MELPALESLGSGALVALVALSAFRLIVQTRRAPGAETLDRIAAAVERIAERGFYGRPANVVSTCETCPHARGDMGNDASASARPL